MAGGGRWWPEGVMAVGAAERERKRARERPRERESDRERHEMEGARSRGGCTGRRWPEVVDGGRRVW